MRQEAKPRQAPALGRPRHSRFSRRSRAAALSSLPRMITTRPRAEVRGAEVAVDAALRTGAEAASLPTGRAAPSASTGDAARTDSRAASMQILVRSMIDKMNNLVFILSAIRPGERTH